MRGMSVALLQNQTNETLQKITMHKTCILNLFFLIIFYSRICLSRHLKGNRKSGDLGELAT